MQARMTTFPRYCKLREQEAIIAAGPKQPKDLSPKIRFKAVVYFQKIITIM